MKLNQLKPGQKFTFRGISSIILMLEEGAVNLRTNRYIKTNDMGDSEVELVDEAATVYHACRQAFVCGQEKVPWHMVLHALREGLDMKNVQTYILKDNDKETYPQLKELICYLKQLSL